MRPLHMLLHKYSCITFPNGISDVKLSFSFYFDTVLIKTTANDIVTACRLLHYNILFLLRQPAAGKDGKMKKSEKTMDKIVALCKNRGYVYPGSEIYGGLANSWDYGPLGVEFKNNVKKAWLKKFVQESPYNVGLDAAIIMNPQTWITTGHVSSFSDPLLDCRACKRAIAPTSSSVRSTMRSTSTQ